MACSKAADLTDDATLLVFHQCMEKEWIAWGRESAREFAEAGFSVIRVKTVHWRELKTTNREASRNPYKAHESEQQMICTIVMRDITCPIVQDVVQRMRSGALSADLRDWETTGLSWSFHLETHHARLIWL